VERELALIKVTSKTAQLRSEIMQVVDIYRARVVDVAMGSLTVEVTGPTDKIDSIVGMLKPYGIKETVRTGTVAMARGVMAGQEKGREALATRETPRLREVS
ncbi:MAG: acetolactate synthase small subunit, partial [Chloroflexota bacterium]|nr:acetolactate synthase small subunit [Chloroflexota bacterium]